MPLASRTEALAASEPGRAASEPQGAAVATEAEGLRLHLSSSGNTGYRGVRKQASGRFQARHMVNGRSVSLGYFDTAVEAAVAYARAVGEYQPPTVATEAEGLRLHLSSRSNAGYSGVCKHRPSGRFEARRKVDGKDVYIGSFGTAVEAAVAYARAVGELQEAGRLRGGGDWISADAAPFAPGSADVRLLAEAMRTRSFPRAVVLTEAMAVQLYGLVMKAKDRKIAGLQCCSLLADVGVQDRCGLYSALASLAAGEYLELRRSAADATTAAKLLELYLKRMYQNCIPELKKMKRVPREAAWLDVLRRDHSKGLSFTFKRDLLVLEEEAEGLRLHLSSSNATGYRGVREDSSSGRFEARHMVNGRSVSLGSCLLPEHLPHQRALCPLHPFHAAERLVAAPIDGNEAVCPNCYCLICDAPVSECRHWRGSDTLAHCNAHSSSTLWRQKRVNAKRQRTRVVRAAQASVDPQLAQPSRTGLRSGLGSTASMFDVAITISPM
ncbi:hypothetical protein EMIHUDRAFT_223336 [Emiliania huxleyi CCMP1516]|uniref:AP2/ERF domain-containing protein n=2 Tax=Emiliania huxleyi TaxID=2903 RepID=A0A0D3KVL5_EMIH1|nr:hypothetical protein EMIHUDRAFT_223336 [Emiliania huxleyi CCMP1516]EOD39800.1 hypothetical protein EMIHUDRAFT_223336 [Emiliania huxleyi CCMP1516]|eukprot:XP_005792229.1 hypothetical protein EMIHUDRAFT_223336 [Emiliania huxleyi CCMP1516]